MVSRITDRARSEAKHGGEIFVSLTLGDLLDEEHALLVGRDDIEHAVAVEVSDDELGADAALVVDLARREGDLAVAPSAASNQ